MIVVYITTALCMCINIMCMVIFIRAVAITFRLQPIKIEPTSFEKACWLKSMLHNPDMSPQLYESLGIDLNHEWEKELQARNQGRLR